MDFFSYLEHLRQKPDSVKRSIALWMSGGITFVVFLFWFSLVTLTPLTHTQEARVGNTTQEENIFKDMFGKIKAGVDTIVNGVQ